MTTENRVNEGTAGGGNPNRGNLSTGATAAAGSRSNRRGNKQNGPPPRRKKNNSQSKGNSQGNNKPNNQKTEASSTEDSINIQQLMQIVTGLQSDVSTLQGTVTRQNGQMKGLKKTITRQNALIKTLQQSGADQVADIQTLQDEVGYLEQWNWIFPPYSDELAERGLLKAETRIGLQKLLTNLQNLIGGIRRGENRGRVFIVPPEDVWPFFSFEWFLPYWKRLGSALLEPSFIASTAENDHSIFLIKSVSLENKIMRKLLEPGLRANRFKTLQFERSELGPEGIKFVTGLVEANPSLETLNLRGIKFEDEDGVRASYDDIYDFCMVIGHHPSLKHFTFEILGFFLLERESSDWLSPLMTAGNRLETIDLQYLNICTWGSVNFHEFLANNVNLVSYNLFGNNLNDEDAVDVAEGLKSNRTLVSLDLRHNRIHWEGFEALLECLFNPASLNSAADSNHKCRITMDKTFYAAARDGRDLPEINTCYDPSTSRKMKLLTLLTAPYEDRVNIHLLEDVPLGLMPKVLAFVQEYPEERQSVPILPNEPEFSHLTEVRHHWGYMSALRPDKPQTSPAKSNSDPPGTRMETEEEKQVREEYESKRRAWMKRLNIVYEIIQGWKMPSTGEPLYLRATGVNM